MAAVWVVAREGWMLTDQPATSRMEWRAGSGSAALAEKRGRARERANSEGRERRSMLEAWHGAAAGGSGKAGVTRAETVAHGREQCLWGEKGAGLSGRTAREGPLIDPPGDQTGGSVLVTNKLGEAGVRVLTAGGKVWDSGGRARKSF